MFRWGNEKLIRALQACWGQQGMKDEFNQLLVEKQSQMFRRDNKGKYITVPLCQNELSPPFFINQTIQLATIVLVVESASLVAAASSNHVNAIIKPVLIAL